MAVGAAVGGGAGTLTEIAMAWQMNRVLVALEIPGWSGELAGRALDSRERAPVLAAKTAEDAVLILARALGV